MTTDTSPPPDSERISHIEGSMEQIVLRFASIDQRFVGMEQRFDGVDRRFDAMERSISSLRNLMFIGFGLIWATMVGGFIAILTLPN